MNDTHGLYLKVGGEFKLFSTNFMLNPEGTHVLQDHRGETDFPEGHYEFMALWGDAEGNNSKATGGPDCKLVLFWATNEYGKRWPSLSGPIDKALVEITPAVRPVALLRYMCALLEGMIVGTSQSQGGTVEATLGKIKQLQRKFGVEGQTGV